MTPEQRMQSPHSLKTKLGRLAWAAVEMTLFRGSFHTFYGWRAFLLRCFGARIGRTCRIRRTASIYYPWNLHLGDRVIIGDNAQLYNLGTLTIGDGAMISQEAYLCGGTHDYTSLALPLVTKTVTIGAEAWVCARAFIGPGVTVGQGAIVAACGVVVRDVEPWAIVGGNPATFIRKRTLKDAPTESQQAAVPASADGRH